MIICLSGFVIAGTSPSALPVTARNDISALERGGLVSCGAGVVAAGPPAAYAPHHHQLLQHFALRGAGAALCSSSSESVSSHSASPPPRGPLRANGGPAGPLGGPAGPLGGPAGPLGATAARVRTLYACLGESEGELSFEPNQIITNVCPSGEPGWLRGSLNGKSGLVPENYVEPLP